MTREKDNKPQETTPTYSLPVDPSEFDWLPSDLWGIIRKFWLPRNTEPREAEYQEKCLVMIPSQPNRLQKITLYMRNPDLATVLCLLYYDLIDSRAETIRWEESSQSLECIKTPLLIEPTPIQKTLFAQARMDVWKYSQNLDKEELKTLILNRGQLNALDISTPAWFSFSFVCSLLRKLAPDPKDWEFGVLLLNNVIGYEVKTGNNCYLVKGMKQVISETGEDEHLVPCINRYRDKVQLREMLNAYGFTWKDKDDQSHKGDWLDIWATSRRRLIIQDSPAFVTYPVTKIPDPTYSKIEKLSKYTPEKSINIFTGYTWDYETLRRAGESDLGKRAISTYLDLLKRVMCNNHMESFKFLEETLGAFVQLPGEKQMYAVYVKGQKGTGKTMLLIKIFQLFFHLHSMYMAGKLVADDFSGKLKDGILMMCVDEFPPVVKNMSVFKSMITENCMNVRAMYSEPVLFPNKMNIICTSNHDPPVTMEITKEERRFFLIENAIFTAAELLKHREFMTEFYKNTLCANDNQGFKAIIWHLLNVPLKPNLLLRMPTTPLFCKTIEKTMSLPEIFVKKCIERGGIRAKQDQLTGQIIYNWDKYDASFEWTWPKLVEEMLANFPDQSHFQTISKMKKNQEYLGIFQFILLPDFNETRGRVVTFGLKSREDHFNHFRKVWPALIWQFENDDLILGETIFQKVIRNGEKTDPRYAALKEGTQGYKEEDYLKLLYQTDKLLRKRFRIELEINPNAIHEEQEKLRKQDASMIVKRVEFKECEEDGDESNGEETSPSKRSKSQ